MKITRDNNQLRKLYLQNLNRQNQKFDEIVDLLTDIEQIENGCIGKNPKAWLLEERKGIFYKMKPFF